jgi:hypothetical protein
LFFFSKNKIFFFKKKKKKKKKGEAWRASPRTSVFILFYMPTFKQDRRSKWRYCAVTRQWSQYDVD